ncbi:cell division protein FtsL [Marinospirillum perlucidum]|uniref:cell division protein FtsL n=1 Tax=Marinospirillum perlucidum TaxID=1982602 RepID=UPI00138FB93C|nr:cell division protein FtsL [Marinospirillum perlucidum]
MDKGLVERLRKISTLVGWQHWRSSHWLLLGVTLAVLISAQFLVQITHQARSQQVRLQTLEGERDALQVEWGRLLLEESALVNPVRLEQLADGQLDLRLPESADIEIRVIR